MFPSTYFPRQYFASSYFTDGAVSTAVYPDPSEVLAGVEYGPNGSDYVGVFTGSTSDLAEVIELLELVKAKTDLLGTGSVVASAPVSTSGKLTTIVIGDDYLAANSRAFEWLVDPVNGFDLEDCTCWFGGAGPGAAENAWLVQGAISVSGEKWKLSFDLAKPKTESLERGNYEWSVAVHDASGTEVTRVRNREGHKVSLVSKFT